MTTASPPAQILDAVHSKKIILLVSDEVVVEYLRVLEYPHIRKYKKITDEVIRDLTSLFIEETERVEILSHIKKSTDPDDDKFIHLALASRAEWLVSGDQDLLSLLPMEGVEILSPAEALRQLA